MVVVVDKYSRSSLCDYNEERKEQLGDHLVINEKKIKILAKNDGSIERSGKDGDYIKR